MVWDRTGWDVHDGIGWDGTGWDSMGWDIHDGIGQDGMGRT